MKVFFTSSVQIYVVYLQPGHREQQQQMHFSISLKSKPRGKEQSPALFSSYDISFYYIFRHRAAALEWQDDTED